MNYFLTHLLPSKTEQVLMGLGGLCGVIVNWAANELHCTIYWLLAFVIIDYITGTFQAGKNHVWCSRQAFRGLLKKVFILIIAVLAHGLAKMVDVPVIETSVMFAFAFTEFGSILENIEMAGYGSIIPQSVRKILEIVKDKENEAIERLK